MLFRLITLLSLTLVLLSFLASCGNQQFGQGEKLYQVHCESCHQANGEGLAKLYPPLKESDYWLNNQKNVPCIIRYGLKDTISVNQTIYSTHMLAIPQLTDYEICNIMNYINQDWYSNIEKIDIKEVKNSLKKCK
jgi:mono/diheme cytochrome c family protein